MGKITFTDKSQTTPYSPAKINAQDINAFKASINILYDGVDVLNAPDGDFLTAPDFAPDIDKPITLILLPEGMVFRFPNAGTNKGKIIITRAKTSTGAIGQPKVRTSSDNHVEILSPAYGYYYIPKAPATASLGYGANAWISDGGVWRCLPFYSVPSPIPQL